MSSLGLIPYLCLTIDKTLLHVRYAACWWRLCIQITFDFWVSWSDATMFPVLTESSRKFKCSCSSSSVATSFPLLTSRTASFCHPWELDAASWLRSLASGFPILDQSVRQGALSIPRLFDAIGSCSVEELVETVKARFIAVGFDFATILACPSCSCILSEIVFVQLVKLNEILRAAI